MGGESGSFWLAWLPMVRPICQDSTVFRCGLTVGKSNSLASEITLMMDIGMHWHLGVLNLYC